MHFSLKGPNRLGMSHGNLHWDTSVFTHAHPEVVLYVSVRVALGLKALSTTLHSTLPHQRGGNAPPSNKQSHTHLLIESYPHPSPLR